MLIRSEIPIDAVNIDALLRDVYQGEEEANLVMTLRENALLTLGMVALNDEGELLAYAAFSPVTIGGNDFQWVALSPLALRKGADGHILGQLVLASLETLNEFGYAAVLALGDATHYQSLGFLNAVDHQLKCYSPSGNEGCSVYPLAPNALMQADTDIHFAAPFYQ